MTSDGYERGGGGGSSVNGSGFRPFDVVIPFSFRKGQITGEGGDAKLLHNLVDTGGLSATNDAAFFQKLVVGI